MNRLDPFQINTSTSLSYVEVIVLHEDIYGTLSTHLQPSDVPNFICVSKAVQSVSLTFIKLQAIRRIQYFLKILNNWRDNNHFCTQIEDIDQKIISFSKAQNLIKIKVTVCEIKQVVLNLFKKLTIRSIKELESQYVQINLPVFFEDVFATAKMYIIDQTIAFTHKSPNLCEKEILFEECANQLIELGDFEKAITIARKIELCLGNTVFERILCNLLEKEKSAKLDCLRKDKCLLSIMNPFIAMNQFGQAINVARSVSNQKLLRLAFKKLKPVVRYMNLNQITLLMDAINQIENRDSKSLIIDDILTVFIR